MKRLFLILLAVLVIFGVVASIASSTQGAPTETPAAETPDAAAAPQTETAAPVEIRTLDQEALRALHGADETVMSLGDERVSWKEYCEWLCSTAQQIEDYFAQMAAYYGVAADWEGSIGDGSGMNFAQYAVYETNTSLSSILAYRSFAAEKQVALSEEEQAGLTDEGLAKALLGESATAEELARQLELEGFSIDSYRRIRETNLLLDKYFDETYGPNGEKVTDETATAWLEEAGYVSAGHILLRTIDPNTGDKLEEAAVAEKRLKAEELVTELRAVEDAAAREQRFLELKEAFCEDGGKRSYPDGYTYTPGTMVAAFEDAAKALAPFEVSDPVESIYGYHVIMRLPLRADSLLYSQQGTPTTARQEAAAAGMNGELADFIEAKPVTFADGIEELNLVQYIK